MMLLIHVAGDRDKTFKGVCLVSEEQNPVLNSASKLTANPHFMECLLPARVILSVSVMTRQLLNRLFSSFFDPRNKSSLLASYRLVNLYDKSSASEPTKFSRLLIYGEIDSPSGCMTGVFFSKVGDFLPLKKEQ